MIEGQVKSIKSTLESNYAKFIKEFTASTAELDAGVGDVIKTQGLEGRTKDMLEAVEDVRKILLANGSNAQIIANQIHDTNRLTQSVLGELIAIGESSDKYNNVSSTMDNITKLLNSQDKLQAVQTNLDYYKQMLATYDARIASGQTLNFSDLTKKIEILPEELRKIEKNNRGS